MQIRMFYKSSKFSKYPKYIGTIPYIDLDCQDKFFDDYLDNEKIDYRIKCHTRVNVYYKDFTFFPLK